MSGFLDRVRAAMGADAVVDDTEVEDGANAPDGNHEELKSGKWSTQTTIPPETFPQDLVLRATDRRLCARIPEPVVLGSVKVGKHRMELLLSGGNDTVDLSMRVPTATNQFKDPYIIMEAEAGNTAEVAVREIHFHLLGRASEAEIARTDWRSFFAGALEALNNVRGKRR